MRPTKPQHVRFACHPYPVHSSMHFTSAMEADTLTLAARPPILPHESTSSGYWTMITPRGRTGRPPQLINHEIGMGMKDYQGPRLGLLCCVRPQVGYLSVGGNSGR
ncbi:hypothetical protein B0J17DRAFT_350940 [Rhizoctonia solani]|nr:hypothetical protein B0J17DRAFT_350940 [Rhizoctonia solani]